MEESAGVDPEVLDKESGQDQKAEEPGLLLAGEITRNAPQVNPAKPRALSNPGILVHKLDSFERSGHIDQFFAP